MIDLALLCRLSVLLRYALAFVPRDARIRPSLGFAFISTNSSLERPL